MSERSEKKMEDLLFDGKSQAFVCIDDGKIIGMSHIKKTGELTLCYVHPHKSGQGVGKMVLDAAEKQALQGVLLKYG